MLVKQTRTFDKTVKKLHSNQKAALDLAIRAIIANPLIGELKKGDLKIVRMYKFQMLNQLMLLAYLYGDMAQKLSFLALGTHENFYRDPKNQPISDHA